MRHILLSIIAVLTFLFPLSSFAALDDYSPNEDIAFPYDNVLLEEEAVEKGAIVDFSGIVHDEIVDEHEEVEGGIISRLIRTMGLDEFARGTDKTSGTTAGGSNYIIKLINYAIGMAAFLALVVMIYGFFKMFFSKEEEGFADAKKIVINAAIAIAIIAVSYFIVAFFFYVFNTVNDVDYETTMHQFKRYLS